MMPVADKSEWPKTVDGTTDWQALFEAPETGFLDLVSATQDPAQLKQQSITIIRALYTRHRDKPVVERITAFLDKLIPEDASAKRLPMMQFKVRQMLDRAKQNRIARAAAFVEKSSKRKKGRDLTKKINRRPNFIVGLFRMVSDVLAALFALVRGGDKTAEKDGEEGNFKQAAYVHDGDGNTEWQDSDMYDMKESKTTEGQFLEDLIKEKKPDGKYESWDDY